MELLQEKFPGRVLSRKGDVNWPPRSCDLTPLDYFPWGYVKSKVYETKPRTVRDLKRNIEQTIEAIPLNMCADVMENWTFRIHSIHQSRGEHLNDILFKT